MSQKNVVIQESEARTMFAWCAAAAVSIAVTCSTMLIAPLVNYSAEEGSRASGMVLSAVTWLLILLSAYLVWRVCSKTAKLARKDHQEEGKTYRKSRIGILSFGKNPEGWTADGLLVLGVLISVLRGMSILHFEGSLRMLQYTLMSTGALLHCFFNGKNYVYIKSRCNFRKRRGKFQ